MRRLILGIMGLLLFSAAGWAQEYNYPKVEAFGGFSISSVGFPTLNPTTLLPTTTRTSFYGWQGSIDGNLNRHLGFVGDFGGQYKTIGIPGILGTPATNLGMSNYQYLFGPRINMRMSKINPFVHFLFGASRTTAAVTVLGVSTAVSSTGLGLGIGGGMDISVSHRLSLRVPQFDWTPSHAGGVWTNNMIRIGLGLVFKAGE